MADLNFWLPDDLASALKMRLADGRYTNAGEYLLALVRRDLEEAADTAWVRGKVEEGLASGFIDRDAREVLREIVAERHARRG